MVPPVAAAGLWFTSMEMGTPRLWTAFFRGWIPFSTGRSWVAIAGANRGGGKGARGVGSRQRYMGVRVGGSPVVQDCDWCQGYTRAYGEKQQGSGDSEVGINFKI